MRSHSYYEHGPAFTHAIPISTDYYQQVAKTLSAAWSTPSQGHAQLNGHIPVPILVPSPAIDVLSYPFYGVDGLPRYIYQRADGFFPGTVSSSNIQSTDNLLVGSYCYFVPVSMPMSMPRSALHLRTAMPPPIILTLGTRS